jgi:hypothetical protein
MCAATLLPISPLTSPASSIASAPVLLLLSWPLSFLLSPLLTPLCLRCNPPHKPLRSLRTLMRTIHRSSVLCRATSLERGQSPRLQQHISFPALLPYMLSPPLLLLLLLLSLLLPRLLLHPPLLLLLLLQPLLPPLLLPPPPLQSLLLTLPCLRCNSCLSPLCSSRASTRTIHRSRRKQCRAVMQVQRRSLWLGLRLMATISALRLPLLLLLLTKLLLSLLAPLYHRSNPHLTPLCSL